MTIQECANGHIYDADLHSACPYCSEAEKSITPPKPYPAAQQQPYPAAQQQPYPAAQQQPYPAAQQQPYPAAQQPYADSLQEEKGNEKAGVSLVCSVFSMILPISCLIQSNSGHLDMSGLGLILEISLCIAAIFLSSSARKDYVVNGKVKAGKAFWIILLVFIRFFVIIAILCTLYCL